MAENLEKDCFTFFAFLPPYIGVSGSFVVSQAQEREEIYRLVSKILNIMPCGSVFGRLTALYGLLLLLFAGAAGNDRQIPTYMVRRNSYYSSAADARTVAR